MSLFKNKTIIMIAHSESHTIRLSILMKAYLAIDHVITFLISAASNHLYKKVISQKAFVTLLAGSRRMSKARFMVFRLVYIRLVCIFTERKMAITMVDGLESIEMVILKHVITMTINMFQYKNTS